MPPFANLRLWLREGPPAEKAASAMALLIALCLVGLALVPVYDSSSGNGVAVASGGAGGPVPGSSALGGNAAVPGATPAASPGSSGIAAAGSSKASIPVSTSGGGSTPATGGQPAGSASASSGATAGTGSVAALQTPTAGQSSACGGRTSSAPGVTATQVHVDMALVDLAGPVGNATFGIRSDMSQIVTAVVNYINKTGGVACGRKLVVTQYKVNPVDSNDEQSKCLQMVQDGVLVAINYAGYVTPVSEQCFVQNHLPLETATSIGNQQGSSSYPYLFSPLDGSEQQVRDGILGLAARGFFKPPQFSGKLGVLEDNCLPSANQEIAKDLAASGVPSHDASIYLLDCALVGQPNQIEQAVLQNKLAGDTEVFLGSTISNNQNYVRIAGSQNFYPRYLTSDYGSNEAPGQTWDPGFDGAIAITSTRAGELDSGIHAPAEVTCNSILTSAGIKPLTSGASDVGASETCDLLFFLAQAIDHAGLNPTRASLVEDLGTMGPFRSAYAGDSSWNRPGQLTGGDFQRAIQYHTACQCWRVVDPSFGPAF